MSDFAICLDGANGVSFGVDAVVIFRCIAGGDGGFGYCFLEEALDEAFFSIDVLDEGAVAENWGAFVCLNKIRECL